jgi:serine/threonine-protein kinase
MVGVQDVSYLNLNYSLNDIKNEKIQNTANTTADFQLLNSNINSTLSSISAYNFTFAYFHPNIGTIKGLEIGTIVDNKIYFIEYFATPIRYHELLPSVLRMIESFEIINV